MKCQVRLGVEETLLGEAFFGREATLCGVKIKHCMTDDGVHTSRAFIDDIHKNDQRLTFSGVGVHHQIQKNQNPVVACSVESV